jgi:hypothetical protein
MTTLPANAPDARPAWFERRSDMATAFGTDTAPAAGAAVAATPDHVVTEVMARPATPDLHARPWPKRCERCHRGGGRRRADRTA